MASSSSSAPQSEVSSVSAANELIPISVVVLTKNEEKNIARCLKALQWCNDLVVVDDDSSDRTREIAAACGARVKRNPFASFAQQRNWALQSAGLQHDWVLMLDADEIMTDELQLEIKTRLSNEDSAVAGFMLCRKTIFLGRWLRYSDGFPVWITRLVHRERASFVDRGHGEKAIAEGDYRFEKLSPPMLHYAFSKGIAEWVSRHNRYSSREAEAELLAEERAQVAIRQLFSPDGYLRRQAILTLSRKLPGRPLLRFLYQYIFKRGFLEGRAGLAFCTLMAFYEALIVLKRREKKLAARGEPL